MVNNDAEVNSPPVPLDFVTPVPLDFVNNEAAPITSMYSTMMAIIPIAVTLRVLLFMKDRKHSYANREGFTSM